MNSIATMLANSIFLLFLLGILTHAVVKKINAFDAFVAGAKQGFALSIRILPYLIAMMVAIGMLRASGFFDVLNRLLAPLFAKIGMPPELLPLALIRPFSGTAATGVMAELIHNEGGNSFLSKMAATIMSSSETTFYVIAVYFGSVGVTKVRHAIWAGLFADIAGLIASVVICRFLFWNA